MRLPLREIRSPRSHQLTADSAKRKLIALLGLERHLTVDAEGAKWVDVPGQVRDTKEKGSKTPS